MSLRNIIIEPDPILREKSLPVEKVDSDLQKLLNEMLETMYAAPGIGLAAVQVGILKRLIVIDISKEKEKKNPLFLINPEITFRSEKTSIYEEGCLSLPGHFAEIERPATCHLDYGDYNGKKKALKAEGLLGTLEHKMVQGISINLGVDKSNRSKLKIEIMIEIMINYKLKEI